ncbi:MAG: HAMP domain-containing sensor histidine kinase [Candidatus Pedobacter colombiensis]|uniref:histidine kinase n=1 Tax=Candidatus Pedobacter colombiensis TaxID=3121371 RepID=A0AAJ5W7U4_9SPHI|nr:HAMP domain-containing sensor histidine kinase [Pedobacter sp.]WEK18791.1 MAG: HAMP domain-containing sensor histidine kinase [Pedobacter sp.]
MKNLLNKPLRIFTLYSFVVLLCSIPVYFIIVDLIWIHEVEEHNHIKSEATKQNLRSIKFEDGQMGKSIALWNQIQPETKLREVDALRSDSTYNEYRKNTYIPGKGFDRFEGLVTYFELNGKFYSLTVETNLEESYETILAITAVTALFFIILLIGFIRLNKRISIKLWQPFYVSLQKIKAFDLSSLEKPEFDKTDIIEFEEMNSSVSRLMDGSISVYKQQREFTENASHELQTPLAVIQSKLDLLLQSQSLSSQQSAIIDESHKALTRVFRINKNLLLLAKIENQQYAGQENINLSLQLEEQIELLSDFLFTKNLKLHQQIAPNVNIEGNRVLVEIMLTNILMNAVRHNVKNGEIGICLEQGELIVSNTAVASLNPEKLFKRFSSAAADSPGSGLGLAIVKEICSRYKWNVSYKFENGAHIFAVSF